VTNGDPEQPTKRIETEPDHPQAAPEPDQVPTGVPQPSEPRRRPLWPWLLGGLIGIAALGAAIGAWLGLRQSGPLSSQSPVSARPTIVVASPAPIVSASSSPIVSPVAPTAVPEAPPRAGTQYVVQPGDTLRSIAQQAYGDAEQWPRIYQANRDVIGPDPDALQAGTRLLLPAAD
jgi:LysM repeat protein